MLEPAIWYSPAYLSSTCPLQAWVEGMYELWPNATAEKPIQVDYEPYNSPTPTITIGNIVPELSPAVGPASISIQCVAVLLRSERMWHGHSKCLTLLRSLPRS